MSARLRHALAGAGSPPPRVAGTVSRRDRPLQREATFKHAGFLKLGALALSACALGLACALHLVCLLRAPAAYFPALVQVRLQPGATVELGRAQLAAPQAAPAHIALRRDGQGRWWLRNSGSARPLVLARGGSEQRTGSLAPRTGLRFQLGATHFNIDAADRHAMSFSDASRRWHYDGATLLRDGHVQPPCPEARLATRLAAAWNRRVPRMLTLARPLSFGGNLDCGNRIGIAGLAPGSAAAMRTGGALLLAAAAGPGRAPLLVADGAGWPDDLALRDEALDGVTSLVVGRTRMLAAIDGGVLALRPASHVALFTAPAARLPPQVAWSWRARDPWALAAPPAWLMALGAAALAAALALLAFRRGAPLTGQGWRAGGLLLATAGAASLLLDRAGTPPGHGIAMLLGWAALWYALLAPGRVTMASAAAVLLLAVGLLFQLELGLGAPESSWLRFFEKSTALLAVGAGAGGLARNTGLRLGQAAAERLLLLLACAALAALLLQVVYGDETGVFGLQPVELAKVALTALTAHCLAVGLGATPAATGMLVRWLRVGAPALLFLALLGLALVQVDDYSPLILLLLWSGAMLLAWSLAARRRSATAALAGLACIAVLGVAALRSAGAAEVAQWSFYADRFLVWLDPQTHPHTGQQLLLAGRAIAAGGWWGQDGMMGLASLGQHAGEAMRIPEVEDDFAPSFFLNRHGLAAGLALWTLQALFIAGLLRGARHAWAAGVAARDFRHAWLARLRCFFLCGGAAFVAGHLLLSWGTNLAILPVMGQPMSFLSAGGSHLLFFICPLLAVARAPVH